MDNTARIVGNLPKHAQTWEKILTTHEDVLFRKREYAYLPFMQIDDELQAVFSDMKCFEESLHVLRASPSQYDRLVDNAQRLTEHYIGRTDFLISTVRALYYDWQEDHPRTLGALIEEEKRKERFVPRVVN